MIPFERLFPERIPDEAVRGSGTAFDANARLTFLRSKVRMMEKAWDAYEDAFRARGRTRAARRNIVTRWLNRLDLRLAFKRPY
ncbi:MAG: hypothetical protein KGI41_03135 [Patescibacteria group bacterium]|nr:hypothetical protein [Patescibacteria group bacterium]MDE1966209.1 hypothetical protein [Patescibacteria group bacterium]